MRRLQTLLFATALSTSLACTQDSGGSPTPDAPKPAASAEPSDAAKPPAVPLPAGADLLVEHVEASGGAAAIDKIESIHAVGTIAAEAQKLTGTMELWWQKGGKVYVEQDIEGLGLTRVGFDGETIWTEDPIAGLRKLDGAEAAAYKQSSLMFLGRDWPQYFSEAKTLAKQTVDGREVWEIELVAKDGPNLTLGLDAETKLINYIRSIQPSMLGDTPIEIRNDRYEEIGGYKFAMHRVNAVSKLLEIEETLTKFEVNVAIDPAMFAYPTKREVVPVDPSQQPPIEGPDEDENDSLR